jgi:hypothetical protein
MGKAFDLTPKKVRPVETSFRRIVTEIPPPEKFSTNTGRRT